MAKLSAIKRVFDWGGNFTTVWGILPAAWQTLITGVLTAMTAWFGIKEVGWAQAIFYASGVLAFGMTTAFLSLRIAQVIGMFQRLSIAGFGIVSVSLSRNNSEISHLNLNVAYGMIANSQCFID
jgi:hypothetical protein